jgi:hypothetical protein
VARQSVLTCMGHECIRAGSLVVPS